MQTIFYGIPAYILNEHMVVDTTKPHAVELGDVERVRIVPLDSSPAYWLSAKPSVTYPDGQLIEVPPSPFRFAAPRKVLSAYSGVGTVFTVVSNGTVAVTNSDETLCEELPDNLYDIRMRASNLNGLTVFALTARRAEGYHLFVAVKKDVWEVRIHETAARIEQRGTETLVLMNTSVSGLIGTVNIYDAAFSLTKSYPVYTGTPSAKDPVLILYDYLKLSLDTEARALLTSSLLTDTPYETVKNFFREYVKVEPALFGGDSVYAFFTSNSHATLYKATFVNGQIDNLEECLHPLFTHKT